MWRRKILTVVLGAAVLWASACSGGEATRADDQAAEQELTSEADEAAERARQAGESIADSDIVAVADSPTRGPADAPVTIVVFSEFQCPFCARGAASLDHLMEMDAYEGQLRVVFKHFPLSFHKQAEHAARAAMAAGEQGEFWGMHDLIFDDQRALRNKDRAQIKELAASYAGQLGLDVEQFEIDYDNDDYDRIIERDVELAGELAIKGTPNFFINGVHVRGAQPISRFEEVIDAQLERAKTLREQGVADAELYRALVADNFQAEDELEELPPVEPPTPEVIVAMVPVEAADAVRGADEPLVTIVEFSSFQCPFCKQVQPSLDRLLDEYGEHVRLVYKHHPLPFHKHAEPAARLALAAQQQGKFWQMKELIFEHQRRLGQEDIFYELGAEIGLTEQAVDAALDSDAHAARLAADRKLAQEVGARGTPTFFVNGVKVIGAQPYDAFSELVDEQVDIAEALLEDDDISSDELYETLVTHNKEAAAGDDEPADARPANPARGVDQLAIDADQVKGPDDAPVTIFVFSDFQCPYCGKAAASLDEALEGYDDKVRVVFKHHPLSFHKQARPAARAAMAAGEQGKFWQMHDLIFSRSEELAREGLFVELADELDLDVDQFDKDLDNEAYEQRIDRDMREGRTLGVRGTPAVFINGRRVTGAQPPAKLKQAIEDALAQIEAETEEE